MPPFASNVAAVFQFFSDQPAIAAMQVAILAVASLLVFLVLFATRDILLRSRSLLAQLASIVLVALLPGIGFLLYLLVRPSRTLAERRIERDLDELILRFPAQPRKHAHSAPKPAKHTAKTPVPVPQQVAGF